MQTNGRRGEVVVGFIRAGKLLHCIVAKRLAGVGLTPASLEMLQLISGDACSNMTQWSVVLSITREAARRTIRRLRDQELLSLLRTDDGDRRTAVMHLSQAGRERLEVGLRILDEMERVFASPKAQAHELDLFARQRLAALRFSGGQLGWFDRQPDFFESGEIGDYD